jgi:DNA-binding transcriptional regulator GbsR (MarR family)
MTKPFAQAAHTFEDGVARICRLYGMNPLAGRLFAILFLAPEPLALDELCERVGAAKSSVSVTLRRLLTVRVVERLPPRPDRRDFYRAISDPWEIIADWSRLFFQPELEMWRESSASLTEALRARDAPRGAANRELRERISRVRSFLELFEGLLASFERSRPSDKPARSIRIRLDEDDA